MTGAQGSDRDLRPHLIAAVLAALAIAALHRLPVALAALTLAAGFALAARPDPRRLLHRLAHVEGFLLILLVFLPFTTPGEALFRLGPLTATTEGATRALLILCKVNAMALTLFTLFDRAAVEWLGRSLAALGVPARFVRLTELLLRHSHTARDGLARQSQAMRARAFRPATNLHTMISTGHLIGGTLLRAFDRAERVEEAMRLRGGSLAAAPMPPMTRPAWVRITSVAVLAAGFVLADRVA